MEEYRNSDFEPENRVPSPEVPENTTNETEAVPVIIPEVSENENMIIQPAEDATVTPSNASYFQEMPPRPPVDPALSRGNGSMPPPPRAPYNNAYSRPVPPPPSANPAFRPAPPAQEPQIKPQQSGEYRYVPPYAGIGANTPGGERPTPPPTHSFTPPSPEPEKKKEKKEKTVRTFSTTALILILVGAVVISFASGMLGALFIEGGLDFNAPAEQEQSHKDDGNDKNSELIINKAEDDDNKAGADTPDNFTGDYDLTDVCAVVSASVVEITTEFNQTYYGYYQYVQEGAGSGVIISNDGYIITNAHVITNSENGKLADAIKIRLNSGDEYTAKIIGSDSDSDIALLKIDAKNLSAATVGNSDKIKVGEQVIAVGNPLGELGGTVTSGIVSATNREISVENNRMTLIQIDAAINPGNSGGGLFNVKGELIGIVNAKTTDVTVEGLGFAIPVNEAVNVAEELESHGYVTGKTYIGISLTDVTDAFTAYYYFRSESTGVYVTDVQEGYNEDVLQYGDRITAINDEEISSTADVKEIVQKCEVGDKLTFTISREGKLKDVKVTCFEYVPENGVSFDE